MKAEEVTPVDITSFSGKELSSAESTTNWWGNSSVTWSDPYYKVPLGGVITSPTINFSLYSKITITVNARTYGGVKEANNKIYIKCDGTEIGSVTPTGKTLSDYTVSTTALSGSKTLTFSCDGASSSVYSGIKGIAITGVASTTSKETPTLTFSTTSFTADKSDDFAEPILSNSGDGDVEYTSNNTDVATVDLNSGEVQLLSKGNVTITATSKETDAYYSNSASYTITVTDKSIPFLGYKKITSEKELIDGGVYFFAGGITESSAFVMGAANTNNRAVVSVSIESDGSIAEPAAINESGAPYEITLIKAGDGFYLQTPDGNYLYNARTAKSGKNYLKATDTQSTDGTLWSYTIAEDGAVKFYNTVSSIESQIMYNSSSALFSCYGSGQSVVYLYQKVTQMDLAAATEGYGTFYTDCAYAMPAGVTGYAVTAAQEAGTLTTATAYAAEQEVPAQTPLLVKGTAGTYYPAVLNKAVTPTYEGSNLLEGTRAADGKTAQSAKSNVYYYKLTVGADSKPGFYWGASNGSAFELTKGTTAYLTVEAGAGAEGFRLDLGTTTGIGNVQTARPADIFDLSGRRVQHAAKGFYIVGGQKVLVK